MQATLPRSAPTAPRALIAALRDWLARRVTAMTTLIAWRNLAHDRMRFAVTLIGIVFSVVLMSLQSGLLVGFARTTAGLVEHSGADLWIVNRGVQGVDLATPVGERRRFQALSVPGVTRAEPVMIGFGMWKRGDGKQESVIVVGLTRDATMGGPWNLVAGGPDALRQPDAVIIDTLYAGKLGVSALGDRVEINGRRARVAGLTQGVRTFTQSPYVFTSLTQARALLGAADDAASYILVTVAPGADVATVAADLSRRIADVDVHTTAAFAKISSDYWLFSTGAGTSLIMSMVLGLVVGVVIVAQTLYATTMDRLSEYATLRAIGGSNAYLYRIILKQAAISAALGYAIGMGLSLALVAGARDASAAPVLPAPLILGLGVVTLVMCLAAALISIRKVMGIDPVSVFK